MTALLAGQAAAILVTALAAGWDYRTGRIPNWITAPPMLAAPLGYGVAAGVWGVVIAVGGLLVCALVPYVLFRTGAMGGGDVKLLAALGALLGPVTGIEAQLVAFIVATVIAVGRLVWRGELAATLLNTAHLVANPLRKKERRVEVTESLMSQVRLGIPALVGTLFAILLGS
jgi:prepilin peptidase CpaA